MRSAVPDPTRFLDWEYTAWFARTRLTTLEHKAALYATELCFRETLYHCAGDLDDHELAGRLCRTGLVVFRPDALAHRKVRAILDYYRHLHLHPWFCELVSIDRVVIREVWRYQLNLASLERAQLLTLLYEASPSILALFHAGEAAPVPCSVMISDCKGSSTPEDRRYWQLRARLGSPHRVEVYLHAADEPADVVRDGGIMLGPEAFATALTVPSLLTVAPRIEALAEELGELARHSSTPDGADRWQVIRDRGATAELNAGQGRNTIAESGTEGWWSLVGLLESRERHLMEHFPDGERRIPDVETIRLCRRLP